ncbi:hypothetical protein BD410DRAFT_781710 [Rickenella mellea]|uniref:Uncharacterized protein n=1 Tax=Rickenella mellea TaxID=50990 RepID=A0A4Y7QKM1_9AGAM|nr:hypothetical protein BD410DRAFT_781710 [Rickenella mellea]
MTPTVGHTIKSVFHLRPRASTDKLFASPSRRANDAWDNSSNTSSDSESSHVSDDRRRRRRDLSERKPSSAPPPLPVKSAYEMGISRPIVPREYLFIDDATPPVEPPKSRKDGGAPKSVRRLSLAKVRLAQDEDFPKEQSSPVRMQFQPLSPPPAHFKRRKQGTKCGDTSDSGSDVVDRAEQRR